MFVRFLRLALAVACAVLFLIEATACPAQSRGAAKPRAEFSTVGRMVHATISPDGKLLATVTEPDSHVVWDIATGERKGSIPGLRFGYLAFSSDSKRIAAVTGERLVIADVGTLDSLAKLEYQGFFPRLSPDWKVLLVPPPPERELPCLLVDVSSGAQIGAPYRHQAIVHAVAFSSDGQQALTASGDKTVRVWNTSDATQRGDLLVHPNAVVYAEFSPDGGKIAAAHKNQASVWDVATSKELFSIQHPGKTADVLLVAFAPDGSKLLSVGTDGTARVWDADTGKPHGTPMRHRGLQNRARFSPDGKRIVTASGDVRIWDVATTRLIGRPLATSANDLSFSADGKLLVTAGDDGVARLWDVP